MELHRAWEIQYKVPVAKLRNDVLTSLNSELKETFLFNAFIKFKNISFKLGLVPNGVLTSLGQID